MISNLQRFDNNGLELIIDTSTGEVFASIRAVARMTHKCSSSIHRYVNGGLKTVAQMELISAEIPTATGLKTATLMNEKQMLEVINHYKPSLLIKFAECGFRVFLHGLAGFRYEVKQTSTNPLEEMESSFKVALNINQLALGSVGVEQAIINSIALEQTQALHPKHAGILEPTREQLNNITVPDAPMNPTQLGEHLGLSARKVNKLLIEKGFQVKNEKRSKKDPAYIPTAKGSEWAVQTTSKGKAGDNTTYFQLRWYPSILKAL